jgi:hypothetical protein
MFSVTSVTCVTDSVLKVVIDISGESSSDHVILEDQQHNKKSSLISTVNKTESVTQVTLVTENIKKNGQSVHFDEKNKLDLTSPKISEDFLLCC